MHEIARAAGVQWHGASNATLIARSEAPTFLEACRGAQVRVVAAEGFDLVEVGRRPDMNAIPRSVRR